MEAKAVLFAGLTLLVGGVAGFVAGYSIAKKRGEEETIQLKEAFEEERKEESPEPTKEPVPEKKPVKVNAAKIATPDKTGVDYRAYNKVIEKEKYAAESESPTEEDVDDEEADEDDFKETYEQRVAREARELHEQDELYLKKEGKKIKVLGSEEVDNDYPDVSYPAEELYYFVDDDILTDEFGKLIDDENETIGPSVRRYGWMQNDNEVVWVRNNPKQADYKIVKQFCSRDDFFGDD